MKNGIILILAIFLTIHAAGAVNNQIENPGFENGFSQKGVANSWNESSDKAKVEVSYSEEKKYVHSGSSAQRIECTKLESGLVQISTPVAVQKSKLHTVSIWLAASEPITVTVSLRMAGKPYVTYAMRSFMVGTDWQEYRFSEMIGVDDNNCRLIIKLEQTGSLWIDDVSCVIALETGFGAAEFSPPAKPIPAALFGLHFNPFNVHKG